ncbi:G2/M phase-specific E3 ubiquitin-protein ligase-like [Pagrus major]|uniref:G2/M phase-specific E3 ubiquitin-protein ligase-like n=1 Tax=Pagrus major TaxID=143350 RepID=UPI003CC888B0
MYCPTCGKEHKNKPNFCSECGKKLQDGGESGDAHARPSKSQNPTLGSFLEYRKRKAEERANFTCGKKAKNKTCKVQAYKEEVGKSYQRIVIYLCHKKDFEEVVELPDTDSDPEIVIKTTSTSFDLADTLPFEPPHKSSPVQKEPDKVKYANLFAPIVIDDDEDEVLVKEEKKDMPSEKSEPTTVQASEIIANLALAIDHKKVSRFNISRSDIWDGAVRGFRRSSYSEKSDIFVKFTDDAGSFEEGLDTGGPRREFLTLLMNHLRNRPIFDGPPEKRYLVYNPSAVREDEYYLAGKMIAVSVVHGGPAPHFLSKDLVNHIIGKPSFSATVEDVKDEDIGRALHQVQEAESEEDLQNIILQNSTMFQTAGCFRPVKACEKRTLVEEYLKWYIIDRNHIAIQRFKDGLASLEFLASAQKHPGVLAPLLCYSAKALTAAEIEHLFSPGFSTKGSNRWQKETKVIGFWADFLLECEARLLLLERSAVGPGVVSQPKNWV